MKYLAIFMLFVSAALFAEEKVVLEVKSVKDWTGAIRKVTCKDGLFDTNKDQFVLITRQQVPVKPGKTYRIYGDFKLKVYAPLGNIRFGVIPVDASGKALRRQYIGESPFNERVASNNFNQVRNFWLTFSGTIPSDKFKFPEGTVAFTVILHQFEDFIVDMNFKNIKVTEE